MADNWWSLALTVVGGVVFSTSDVIAMGRLRDYAWTPAGRKNPQLVRWLMRAQSWITKAIALVIWFGFASSVRAGGGSAMVQAASTLLAVSGAWLALHGQYWLPRRWRRSRARHLLRTGRDLSFEGTLMPAPNSYYDRECTFRANQRSLALVSDGSLPSRLGLQISGTTSAASLRRADLEDAPGRPGWWSLTVVDPDHGNTWTISAEREYVEVLPDWSPFVVDLSRWPPN